MARRALRSSETRGTKVADRRNSCRNDRTGGSDTGTGSITNTCAACACYACKMTWLPQKSCAG